MSLAIQGAPQEKTSLLYDPKVRGVVWQAVLLLLVAFIFYTATTNAIENLQKAGRSPRASASGPPSRASTSVSG